MKKIILALTLAAALTACKTGAPLLPNVSGKAGEVLVVMEKSQWEDSLGAATRDLLASECPYLALSEPLYTLVNVTPSAFGDIFKVHRNIVYFNVNAAVDSASVFYRHNVWAQPQCVIQLNAKDAEEAVRLMDGNSANILSAIEQAERDRVVANCIRYEEKSLGEEVSEIFGGTMHFPMGYKLRKKTADFIWIADDKQYTMQDILIYSRSADGRTDFEPETIIRRRNEMARNNIPGMYENTWMTTAEFFTPQFENLGYKGRRFVQTRGYWEVENDYMGGPFVSHSFYSPDGRSVITAEAFIYSPKYDKR